jgi:hypothetical protein
VAAWIALSLIVLTYLGFEGESALAKLDSYDLVTIYSSAPLIEP